jgi:hypothetical protein
MHIGECELSAGIEGLITTEAQGNRGEDGTEEETARETGITPSGSSFFSLRSLRPLREACF